MNDREIIGRLRQEVRNGFDPATANSNYVSGMSRIGVRYDEPDQIPGTSAFALNQFVDLLNAVFRGQPANPSRSEIVERLDAAYAADAPRAEVKKDGAQLLAFGDIAGLIERYITEVDYVGVVGARGIGKTNLINKWLNHRSASFLESELRFAWFRVDMSKVYS